MVLSMLLLLGKLQLTAYVVSAVVYGIAWNVSMTYQYSTVNLVDRSRRGVALAPAFHNAGGAVGPALAALVVTASDHSSVLWLVGVSVLASLVCFALALRLHARAAAGAAAAVQPARYPEARPPMGLWPLSPLTGARRGAGRRELPRYWR